MDRLKLFARLKSSIIAFYYNVMFYKELTCCNVNKTFVWRLIMSTILISKVPCHRALQLFGRYSFPVR